MDREIVCSKIDEAISHFDFKGNLLTKVPYGKGHINDTFLLEFKSGEKKEKYIFQRINHQVFTRPEELMENIEGVTSFLKERILEQGGDYKRETLCVVHTKNKKSCYKDSIGSYWRAFIFIENAISYERAENPDVFYESGHTLGKFQGLLTGYEAKKLHETIPNFHNTAIRFGASTALEDEIDLDKVSFDLTLFEAYTKGYLEGCQGKLEGKEVEMLPMGAKVMTYECGIRFLTDYLQGDKYFKIHRENHNLDRCRTQFKLVEDMELKWDSMKKIVHKYSSLYH